MRRVTLRLVPFLVLLYVCAFIDRTNVGIAALQMNEDLRFSAGVYGFGAGIFFLAYGLFEVPSNLVLARVGARRWIGRIMITWGFLAASMMFVRTPFSFYVLRFLLGVAEAGFFPGVIYYLSNWFPAADRARAVSRFMLGVPIASMISGALAGPILGLRGTMGLAGWQWLFLLEGLPTVVCGGIALIYLTDSPDGARWLTDGERHWLLGRLQSERAQCIRAHGSSVRKALRNLNVWRLGLLWSLMFMSTNAYTFWAPQLIKNLFAGRSVAWVGGLLVAISFGNGIFIVLNGAHSDRCRERWLHVGIPFAIASASWLVVSAGISPVATIVALGCAYISVSSIYGPFWSIPSEFLAGDGAAAGLALISSLGALGAFAGPNVLGMAQQVFGSQRGGFATLACGMALAAAVSMQGRRAARVKLL